mmetsp:Transcript_21521/g.32570  ORF Transcript_21521/g.32570 Transcript_21521/m.32570 type:complete len:97 (+) Transcript_21521:4039-4329(+)
MGPPGRIFVDETPTHTREWYHLLVRLGSAGCGKCCGNDDDDNDDAFPKSRAVVVQSYYYCSRGIVDDGPDDDDEGSSSSSFRSFSWYKKESRIKVV